MTRGNKEGSCLNSLPSRDKQEALHYCQWSLSLSFTLNSPSHVGSTNRSQGQAHGCPGQDQGQPLSGQGQDQGQPVGDQGLPLGRQCQAQARGGLGQTQGGPTPGSAGQALGLLGMLGGAPAHVSVAASAASASVVPTSGYFGTLKCQAVEINAQRVFCPKHACRAHGSQDLLVIRRRLLRLSPIPLLWKCLKHRRGSLKQVCQPPVQIRREFC